MIERRTALKRWLKNINDVLNSHWAPIPDAPSDEYESYAARIAAMIRHHATDRELIKYLQWAEVENMGLGQPFDIERARTVVASLSALDTSDVFQKP
jgi:hypothetical protein